MSRDLGAILSFDFVERTSDRGAADGANARTDGGACGGIADGIPDDGADARPTQTAEKRSTIRTIR
jgi:hypothetical protein